MSRRVLSDDEKAEIIKMASMNVRVQDIAEELVCSTATVYNVLREAGVPTPTSGGLASRFDEDELNRLIGDYDNEMPMWQIQKNYGISQAQLYRLLREVGRQPRRVSKTHLEGRKAQLDHAIQMYIDGVPIWRIQQESGVSQTALHHEIHKRDVPLRQPKYSDR